MSEYLRNKVAHLNRRKKQKERILHEGGEQAKSHSFGDIRRIERAIRRILAGTYGHCQDCGVKIEEERLSIIPEAELCIECQTALERGQIRYHHPNRSNVHH